ncbi:MAG: YggT family protein [Dongiaceae bacterium]
MHSVAWLVDTVVSIYIWLLLARIILGLLVQFNVVNTRHQIIGTVGGFLYQITEPALKPIRRVVPLLGGIDISPMVLVLLLYFLQNLFFEYVL